LDRFVQGNREALALVCVPSEAEVQKRAIHRQREQLVKTRKLLEAQGRSLMVNYGIEPVMAATPDYAQANTVAARPGCKVV